ncbi:MAG: ActS/PrrB/RegB family redox-sensitive histidine kinase [Ahrensia sp.]|nr:ActS/PrrB/RegB family redox-sensitive histidine kinase [Ahrensia sp.]
MPDTDLVHAIRERVLIRLDTLIRLRWYAIIGQFGAVLVVAFGFQYTLPLLPCLVLIAVSALLNLFLAWRYRTNFRLDSRNAFALLAFDILQLAALLYLTGGLQNPFAILLMAPVIVSSTSLKRNHTLLLGLLSIASVSLLAYQHLPLPWASQTPLVMPLRYIIGTWVAIVCTLAFTAIYAFRVAQEARKLADALAATEIVLQREQHLSALDGLAAAAAHELGTPLATIALVSKEMLHAFPPGSDMHEDVQLLRSQAQRCRDILQQLTSLSSTAEPIMTQQTLAAMMEEVVAPLRDFGIEITVLRKGDKANLPQIERNLGLQYSLGNLVDNAVDFARSQVSVELDWSASAVSITISDDGPGFPPSMIERLGEPFTTSRGKEPGKRPRGLGLGLFIAKTLLERSGATLAFENVPGERGSVAGARAVIRWPRARLTLPQAQNETPMTAVKLNA